MAANDVVINIKARDSASGTIDSISGKLKGALVLGAAAGAAAIAGVGVASVMAASKFETAFAEVTTLFDAPKREVEALRSGVLDLASSMGVNAVEASNALYQAISAGVPPGNAVEFLRENTQFAIAGVTDLATAVDLTTTVLNAWGLETSELGRVQDVLFAGVRAGKTTVQELGASMFQVAPIAAALNVPIEAVTAGLATLTAQGVPTAQAATQMKAAFAELGKEGTKADKAFQDITGQSFPAFIAGGGTVEQALNAMDAAATANNSSVLDMFGSIEAGQAILGLTGENAEAFGANLETVANSSGLVDEAAEKMNATFGRQFEMLKSQLGVVLIDIGSRVLPILTSAMQSLLPAIRFVTDVFFDLLSVLSGGEADAQRKQIERLPSVMRDAANAGDEMGRVFSILPESIRPFAEKLMELKRIIQEDIMPAVKDFADVVGPQLKAAFDIVLPVTREIATVVGIVLKEAFEDAFAVIRGSVRFLDNNREVLVGLLATIAVVISATLVPALVAWTAAEIAKTAAMIAAGVAFLAANAPLVAIALAIGGLVAGIALLITHWDDVTAALGWFIDKVTEVPVIGDVIQFAMDRIVVKIEAVKDIFMTVIDTAKEVISFFTNVFSGDWDAAWQDLKDIAENILKLFIDFLQFTFIADAIAAFAAFVPWEWVRDHVVAFVDEVKAVLDKVVEFFGALPGRITGALGDMLGLLVGTGEDVMKGLKDGILSIYQDNIAPWFRDLPGRIIGLVGNALTILYQVGYDFLVGLKDGIVAGFGAVKDTIMDKVNPKKWVFGSDIFEVYEETGRGAGRNLMAGIAVGMQEAMPRVSQTAATLAEEVVETWRDRTLAAIPMIRSVLDILGQELFQWFELVNNRVVAHIASTTEELRQAIGFYIAAVIKEGDALNDWITHIPEVMRPAIIEAGEILAGLGTQAEDTLLTFVSATEAAMERTLEVFVQFAEDAKAVIQDAMQSMAATVGDAMLWIGNSIAATFAAVRDGAYGAANDLVDALGGAARLIAERFGISIEAVNALLLSLAVQAGFVARDMDAEFNEFLASLAEGFGITIDELKAMFQDLAEEAEKAANATTESWLDATGAMLDAAGALKMVADEAADATGAVVALGNALAQTQGMFGVGGALSPAQQAWSLESVPSQLRDMFAAAMGPGGIPGATQHGGLFVRVPGIDERLPGVRIEGGEGGATTLGAAIVSPRRLTREEMEAIAADLGIDVSMLRVAVDRSAFAITRFEDALATPDWRAAVSEAGATGGSAAMLEMVANLQRTAGMLTRIGGGGLPEDWEPSPWVWENVMTEQGRRHWRSDTGRESPEGVGGGPFRERDVTLESSGLLTPGSDPSTPDHFVLQETIRDAFIEALETVGITGTLRRDNLVDELLAAGI